MTRKTAVEWQSEAGKEEPEGHPQGLTAMRARRPCFINISFGCLSRRLPSGRRYRLDPRTRSRNEVAPVSRVDFLISTTVLLKKINLLRLFHFLIFYARRKILSKNHYEIHIKNDEEAGNKRNSATSASRVYGTRRGDSPSGPSKLLPSQWIFSIYKS